MEYNDEMALAMKKVLNLGGIVSLAEVRLNFLE